ncbi:hypothetical protein SeLEV6574_g06186, partial [Synchytrium endobioticum]
MGKNIMIIAFAALLIFVTLTQSTPRHPYDTEIDAYTTNIEKLRLDLQSDMNEIKRRTLANYQYRGITFREILEKDFESRSRALQSTAGWTQRWTYEQLIELPKTDNRLLPVCIAHEELIIDRANHDIIRLQQYRAATFKRSKKTKVDLRLSLYVQFIEDHRKKIELFRQGDMVGTSEPMATSTNYVDRPTLDLLSQHRAYDSDAPPSGTSDRINRPV